MQDRKIILIGSGNGWHARSLIRAFKKRGVNPLIVPMDKCAFSTRSQSGLDLPGLDGELPQAAFVRMMPPGTFEEITVYLGILHALEFKRVPVWNSAKAIERCTDKSTTTFLLAEEGLNTPETWTGMDLDAARELIVAAGNQGRRIVQKPLFGSQGKGLRLLDRFEDLSHDGETNGVYYLQEYIEPKDGMAQDWRIFVCGSDILGAMIRRSDSWITNVRQGGEARAAVPDQEICDIALRAVKCTGSSYAGVDIIQDINGKHYVLEVNTMPAWMALQRVTRVKIAEKIVKAFLEEIFGTNLEQQVEV